MYQDKNNLNSIVKFSLSLVVAIALTSCNSQEADIELKNNINGSTIVPTATPDPDTDPLPTATPPTDPDTDPLPTATPPTDPDPDPDPVQGSAVDIHGLDLTTGGRIGFYIDYSELEAPGTHKFYITRTHGTHGAVSVEYETGGDLHTNVSGTGRLDWAHNDASIKVVTVDVLSKDKGDHRMFMKLTNARQETNSGLTLEGQVKLHHQTTIAYGIIDDNTIATSNALFINATLSVQDPNADGSKEKPYNNWYDARKAVELTTKYIYIAGFMTPKSGKDNLSSGDPALRYFDLRTVENGVWSGNNISGRSSELQRLSIRQWPGKSQGGIDGGGDNLVSGFHSEASDHYLTFRKLQFVNLNTTANTSSKVYAFHLRSSAHYWTIEENKFDNIISGYAVATAPYISHGSSRGHKIWKNHFGKVGNNTPGRSLTTIEVYDTPDLSIQRNYFSPESTDIYQKGGTDLGAGLSIRFNHLNKGTIRLSSTSSKQSQYHIIQGNVFDNVGSENGNFGGSIRFDYQNNNLERKKHWIVGNIFNKSDKWGILKDYTGLFTDMILFNNIFVDYSKPVRIDNSVPEFMNFNSYYANGPIYFVITPVVLVNWEKPISDIQDRLGLEQNAVFENPMIKNVDNNEFQLSEGSPVIGAGVSDTDMGVYLTGAEIIGNVGLQNK